MKKKIKILAVVIAIVSMISMCFVGCTETDKVVWNTRHEADNFNIQRRITVMNTITDTVLFQMTGNFSIQNNDHDELVVVCETGENEYKKHFVYLNKFTTYVVEDVSGAEVDKYKYEINFLPEYGVKVTTKK